MAKVTISRHIFQPLMLAMIDTPLDSLVNAIGTNANNINQKRSNTTEYQEELKRQSVYVTHDYGKATKTKWELVNLLIVPEDESPGNGDDDGDSGEDED